MTEKAEIIKEIEQQYGIECDANFDHANVGTILKARSKSIYYCKLGFMVLKQCLPADLPAPRKTHRL